MLAADLLAGAPERVAIVDAVSGETETRGRLAARVGGVAEAARHDGRRLAFVYVANRLTDVAAELGFEQGGAVVVLLDASLREASREVIERAYRPDLVAGSVPSGAPLEAGERWVEAGAGGVNWWEVAGRAPSADLHADLALCLSTSGSTGSPKLVRLSATNVVRNARSIVEALHIGPDEVAFAHLPLHYSYGLSVLHSHLAAASAVVLTTASALRPEFWHQLNAHRVTTLPHVPYGYQMLDRAGFAERDLPSLHTLTQAGGRLDAGHAARLHRLMTGRGGRFIVMYGQTEATARMAVLPSERFDERPGSVGAAIPGGSFEIVRDDSAVGAPGEVVYRGPNVMLGYALDRHDLARGDELAGVLPTGDEGVLEGDLLTITGRRSRMAKVFGLRFALDEIEQALEPHGTVAAIEGDNEIVLFCEARTDVEQRTLARDLARELRIPASGVRVVGIDDLPRTTSGKVAYAELRQWG